MSDVLKRAIDERFPLWRQVRAVPEASTPPLILVEVDEQILVFAAADGVAVFGAGHLSIEEWWQSGGSGACLKTDASILDELDQEVVPGFLHLHRFGQYTLRTGLEAEALSWLAAHPHEFSCFIPVEFVREGTEMYPWRARPRRS
jgi:hypothetical protein